MVIILNTTEIQYLQSFHFLKHITPPVNDFKKNITLNLDIDTIETIRDWASERSQLVGFNEKYELTPEGIILNDIIDKLYF